MREAETPFRCAISAWAELRAPGERCHPTWDLMALHHAGWWRIFANPDDKDANTIEIYTDPSG
eukprot:482646-Alexandrium_andersonii.AAC.1